MASSEIKFERHNV